MKNKNTCQPKFYIKLQLLASSQKSGFRHQQLQNRRLHVLPCLPDIALAQSANKGGVTFSLAPTFRINFICENYTVLVGKLNFNFLVRRWRSASGNASLNLIVISLFASIVLSYFARNILSIFVTFLLPGQLSASTPYG